METNNRPCTLCQTAIRTTLYSHDQLPFCCTGCQTVYSILSAQNVVAHFKDHPIFKQALQCGLISNPNLIEEIRLNRDKDIDFKDYSKIYLEIGEMWCPSCALLIKLVLEKQLGIKQCSVDYCTDLASIEFTPFLISKEKIIRIIEQLGYRPISIQIERGQAVSRSLALRFIVAAFFALNIMMFSYPIYTSYFHEHMDEYPLLFAWLSLLGSLPVMTYSAWPIWKRFWNGLRVGIWGMESLIFMGTFSAFILSLVALLTGSPYVYFDSMSVIIAFVLLGKIFESKAKFSAKDSLLHLVKAMPRRGRKRDATGKEAFVPLKEILPGDLLIVLAGEKIVLDGSVQEGEGTCDESLLTGESIPVFKKKGDLILAGTLLQQGHLAIKVTSKPTETALYQIYEIVEMDIGRKTDAISLVDRIVKWFVPTVLFLGLASACYCILSHTSDGASTPFQTAILRFAAVLLISCPCAIGIAAPLAESYVITAMAAMGAIIRNRLCLRFLGREDSVIFDKTGTITEGKFTVCEGLEKLSFTEHCQLKGLIAHSNHPLSVAINSALLCVPSCFDKIEEVAGKGIKGLLHDDLFLLGSELFLKENHLIIHSDESSDGWLTPVYFAKNRNLITKILLGDRIRPESLTLSCQLNDMQSYLVSGDSERVVASVAKQCGFTFWRARQLPLEKRTFIDQLQSSGKVVLMIGDGMNDAPALTTADVGIAVMTASDMSVQVSDILLTKPRLDKLVFLRKIAKFGRKIVYQNLFWAFFYNCLGIGLAMAGLLTPLFATFAMMVSSLIVLLNTYRITQNSG